MYPTLVTLMPETLPSNPVCQNLLTSRMSFSSLRPPATMDRIARGKPWPQSGVSVVPFTGPKDQKFVKNQQDWQFELVAFASRINLG